MQLKINLKNMFYPNSQVEYASDVLVKEIAYQIVQKNVGVTADVMSDNFEISIDVCNLFGMSDTKKFKEYLLDDLRKKITEEIFKEMIDDLKDSLEPSLREKVSDKIEKDSSKACERIINGAYGYNNLDDLIREELEKAIYGEKSIEGEDNASE